MAQADLSRSRIQALIRDGRATVNGRAAAGSRKLRSGDRVTLVIPAVAAPTVIEPEAIPLRVVYEDDDLLVIDKPAGLVVHPGAGVSGGTLVHALVHRDPSIVTVGGAGRPGIVHRLDKDTSGLMVVARTARAHRGLVEALRERRVKRVYHAIVWGDPRTDEGEIRGAIGRDPRLRSRMAVVKRGGKPAATRWHVLERFGPFTLLEVTLETGRTHQIRVHLAHAGHAVLGDPTYGGRTKKGLSPSDAQRSLARGLLDGLSRQALHAIRLELEHPVTGRFLAFQSPWPEDLAAAVNRLRTFLGRRRV